MSLRSRAQVPLPEKKSVPRVAGSIKAIDKNSVTLTSDSGEQQEVSLSDSTKILRLPSGATDLKQAEPVTMQDLRPGDRVVVRGQAAASGQPFSAALILLMRQQDVAAKQEQDRGDWQKRGVGGIVTGVDAEHGAITINAGGLGASRPIIVHASGTTVALRYAPASVKFDTAKPAPLGEIRVGDQLRARGTRTPEGNELTAEEIISGSFRNVAGSITALDPANSSITVEDLIQKAPVTVKVSPESQMRAMPPEVAQRVAMAVRASGAEHGGEAAPAEQRRHAGGADLQKFLARMPDTKLTDLKKGDAVMVVTTPEQGAGPVTAITLLSGVEPILTAAPRKNASAALSAWNLGTSGGEGDAGP
ncbi:MAG: hypothetical protein H0X25_10250 [Acidobacteriales bacterium]|nr:hypothetical protein [Terriglobales bacterium]